MRIWIVRDGEPIPSDPGDPRLMRMGMLSAALAARGHEIVWYTSSFDHYQKRQRSRADRTEKASERLSIHIIQAPGYRRNVSLERIRHNRRFARRWREIVNTMPAPDVLVTDIPTTETAEVVTAFGKGRGIPVMLSIRDLWPDFFLDHLPRLVRPLARPFIAPLDRQARRACARATSLVGISEGYLNWALAKAGRVRSGEDRVIPLGYSPRAVPPPDVLAVLRRKLDIAASTPIASFVGSWGATYDLDLLAETARSLSDLNLTIVVAGNTSASSHIARVMAKLPNVRLVGWLSGSEIAALLAQSTLGLLPYRESAPQGLPNKVFEYMAYGAFGVSTLSGELATLYADTLTGACCAPTASAFATAIRRALRVPPDRSAIVAQFEQRFDAKLVYATMADHIEHIATQNRAPR